MTYFSVEMLKAIRKAADEEDRRINDRYWWDRRQEDEEIEAKQGEEQEEKDRQRKIEEELIQLEAEAAARVTAISEPEPEGIEETRYGQSHQQANEPMMA